MISFKDYVRDGDEVKVVTVLKEGVDFGDVATRSTINAALSEALSKGFINPYVGWHQVKKVLEHYNIALPGVLFRNLVEDEEILVVETTDRDYYLHFGYSLNMEDGSYYDIDASILTEKNLNELISMDDTDE